MSASARQWLTGQAPALMMFTGGVLEEARFEFHSSNCESSLIHGNCSIDLGCRVGEHRSYHANNSKRKHG